MAKPQAGTEPGRDTIKTAVVTACGDDVQMPSSPRPAKAAEPLHTMDAKDTTPLPPA